MKESRKNDKNYGNKKDSKFLSKDRPNVKIYGKKRAVSASTVKET